MMGAGPARGVQLGLRRPAGHCPSTRTGGCPSSMTRQDLRPHLPKPLRARGPSRPGTCCYAPGARAGPGYDSDGRL
jgi:hypothetical protein